MRINIKKFEEYAEKSDKWYKNDTCWVCDMGEFGIVINHADFGNGIALNQVAINYCKEDMDDYEDDIIDEISTDIIDEIIVISKYREV